MLGPMLNVNYGVINYNLAPVAVLEQQAPAALPPARVASAAGGVLRAVGLVILAILIPLALFIAITAAMA